MLGRFNKSTELYPPIMLLLGVAIAISTKNVANDVSKRTLNITLSTAASLYRKYSTRGRVER